MGKKKASSAPSKAAAKAAKKTKATQKIERKEKKKKPSKAKDDFEEDEQNLEEILENIRREWEAAHAVTEELVEGPPSRRANATLTPCPNGNHLWCIGGEFFSEDGKAHFYSDVYRYSPEKDEWRKFISPTCPGPRSAHAVVATPAGGGKLFLFGGEYSSLYQNTFHHYRDFWCFDISTHSWDRIDTKIRPTARSGHRMAMWKHYVVLFGGFYDPGITTRYLNDLWLFDTQEYKWQTIEFKDVDRKPSPRSGFSFLPTPDGIILHGGYCKEYAKGKRPVGVMLEDTWFLRMSITTPAEGASSKNASPLSVRWERRKRPSTAYAPSLRSGCTMTPWTTRNMGILFGGVTDEDTGEETMESVFWNDLNGYQLNGTGKWVSLMLKKAKKGGAKQKKPTPARRDDRGSDDEGENASQAQEVSGCAHRRTNSADPEIDPDDPILSTPMPRYNAMLSVLRNTLYIYGGIFERGKREYTLDDFYALQLDKMDRYVCLKASDVVIPAGDSSESSSDSDDSGESGGESETYNGDDDATAVDPIEAAQKVEVEDDIPLEEEEEASAEEAVISLREQATAFMGIAKDTTRTEEDVLSTPLPGETLAMFYARSRLYWAQKARENSDNRGKELQREGFSLAQKKYAAYKPVLAEVERILAEAGLDEEEMKRGGATAAGGTGQSRNRR
ncbi:galactose oxidase [Artomyces pyxidatus]|uniref:Galactose oxidase n=1 Tax=Artomyces pyxidatus TaxID=48021 RepID=A0ACB8SQL6_9AGAM|nr:galactose oxidase [Artomyces pyxidatus]